MGVTLQDVAERANVAPSAVSVVLRDTPVAKRYRQTTKMRIFNAAEELNYQPNFFASQLHKHNRRVLMVCMSYFQDPFSAVVVDGLERRASERRYRLLISVFREKQEGLDIVGKHGITGMAVIGSHTEKLADEAILAIAGNGAKIVLIGRELEGDHVSQVLTDNYAGATQTAKYFYDQGVRDIWVFASEREDVLLNNRAKAVQDYARQNKYPEPTFVYVVPSDTAHGHAAAGYETVRKKLTESPVPHGIIANGDYLAYGAITALTEAGHRVGKDVGVIGFDNAWTSEFTVPPLTTVCQPMIEMGEAAADILIDTIEGKVSLGRKIVFTPKLIIRKSGYVTLTKT